MGAASAAPQCVEGQGDMRRWKDSPSCGGRLSHPIPARTCPCSHSKPWEPGGAGEGRTGNLLQTPRTNTKSMWPKCPGGADTPGVLRPLSPSLPAWRAEDGDAGIQGCRDMGRGVVPAHRCLRLLPCLAAPRREPLPAPGCWGSVDQPLRPGARRLGKANPYHVCSIDLAPRRGFNQPLACTLQH